MSIAKSLNNIPIDTVVIKEGRQRKTLINIPELAASIEANGLFNPIILDKGDKSLLAGERRLTAYKYLRDRWTPSEEGSDEVNPWASIPFRYYTVAGPLTSRKVELEENIQREELIWADRALAIAEMHGLLVEERGEEWTPAHTGRELRINGTAIGQSLVVAKQISSGNQLVINSASLNEAYNKCKRVLDRALGNEMNAMMAAAAAAVRTAPQVSGIDEKPPENMPHAAPTLTVGGGQNRPAPTTHAPAADGTGANRHTATPAIPATPKPTPAVSPILQADFLTWAQEYSGEPFNFLHCDFPYGVNHQRSAQGRTAEYGAYADQEDVYWKLLEGLANHRSRFMGPSAHIMFWFSMKFYRETMDFFDKRMPEFTFEEFPLIWWKDRSIAPDTERRPRRAYEACLFGWSGNRKLLSTRTNVVQHPCGQKTHASEKPAGMLRDFFRMVVDNHTRMLDPTCGSGTSVRAAKSLGASTVLGIEMNPDFAANAQHQYNLAAMIGFANAGAIKEETDVA